MSDWDWSATQGIAGFSQSLAAEVGAQGVRVIAFGPDMVDTPGIRSVAADLAPRLGMTTDQFLSVPRHPAYDGLMPPEDSGAAAAYLIACLAEEYHGEIVIGLVSYPLDPDRNSAPVRIFSICPYNRDNVGHTASQGELSCHNYCLLPRPCCTPSP